MSSVSSRQFGNSKNNRHELAGMRKIGGIRSSDKKNFGDWERHTTGIGSKLMKQMGYEEGKGLGKNLQGISMPVEANKRRGKGAIGFYGTERPGSEVMVQDPDQKEKEKFQEQLEQWRKTGIKKRPKYSYKSAEEVIQEGKTKKLRPTGDNHITKTKVIDMTGPEMRVLSSYHAIGGQKTVIDEYEETRQQKYESFDLPELIHNLDLILAKSEDDIIRNARTKERESDRIVHLNHEREKYEVLLQKEEKELKSIDDALALMEQLDNRHKDGVLTLSDAESFFRELKFKYSKIFYTYEIAYLAPTYIIPLLKEMFSTWNPLAQPLLHKDVMQRWQELVETEGASAQTQQPLGDQPMDPYQQLMWETWAAAVRSAVMGPWEPRDCVPLLTVLESWVPPLVPIWVQSHILQNVVLPRISRAVHNWNPMQDTVPIHTWLHPWLPLLSDHLQVVYPVIRQKLSNALIHWHPSDRSAKMVLHPWKGVFSDVAMATLIRTNIQPKLETVLMEMSITPHNQTLDAWHWFKDWEDLIPCQVILDILERCFFTRWYQALGTWLSASPAHAEVVSWYKGWRDLMPVSVVNHQQIKQKFQQALEICRRALSFQPGAGDQFGLLLSGLEKLSEPPPPPPPGSPPTQKTRDWADIISSARRDNLTMRDMVERRCQERGIVFLPIPDRNHEGRPVYRCGNLNVSFNKTIIYVQTERGWMPKSLTTLLDDATT